MHIGSYSFESVKGIERMRIDKNYETPIIMTK
jgi:hypothetical protein